MTPAATNPDRLRPLSAAPSSTASDAKRAAPPLLQVRRLTRHFGGLTAVSDLDFDLQRSEILALIGPNGAGKSTTFNMIAGTLAPSAGEILLEGESVGTYPPHRLASLGVMRTFQHNCLFPGMSLRENVLTGMHGALQRPLWKVMLALRAQREAEARAWQYADELLEFVGLADQRDQPVATLSFGQGRLLETARALAGRPKLILFDEPAAGLTPSECERMALILRQIARQGTGVLLIEHDMPFLLPLADQVVVLNFGQCIASGTADEIRADPEVIEAYLGSRHGAADPAKNVPASTDCANVQLSSADSVDNRPAVASTVSGATSGAADA